MGTVLVRGLLARCDARETESDRGWLAGPGAFQHRNIPEGTLVRTQDGEDWVLAWWRAEGEVVPLARGTLADIESDTREVVLFGLPGGVDDGQPPWSFFEGSLHATVKGGTYRLMMHPGGRGALVFIRPDNRVVFLGEDEIDALKATAEERLRSHRGAPLRVLFAGQHLELHGLGVLGAVGQVELARGRRLLLVQVDRDRFELHLAARSGDCRAVGEFTGAELGAGDLGEILVTGRTQPEVGGTAGEARPRRPPHFGRARSTTTASQSAPRHSEPRKLSAEDVRRLASCLCLTRIPTGAGASELANLFAGFRVLITLGFENQLMWGRQVRDLLVRRGGVEIVGRTRTFTRALMRFLEMTGLGRRDGRRFWLFFGDVRRGDSDVAAVIRERFPMPDAEQQPADTTPQAMPAPVTPAAAASPRTDSGTSPMTMVDPTPTSTPAAFRMPAHVVGGLGIPAAPSSGGAEVTATREVGIEFGPDGSAGDFPAPSRDHDGRTRYWTRTIERAALKDAPSRYAGKGKKPP